jgi:tRNA threonylcarbamoyladenosine biosynthesis protein TsaB
MPAQPLILAVDATGEHGSLALARGGAVVEELALHSPSGFAHVLFGSLQELLARNGVAAAQIDCFASASGPGSFTGVRVGLAFAKGLAEALGKPAVAVSNLRALAEFGEAPLRATLLDARRGEVYAAVYDGAGQAVSPEVVANFNSWLERLEFDDVEFISPDFSAFGDGFTGTRFEEARRVTAPRALAGAIALIAAGVFERGEAADPAALDANYVRRSDAELFWKEA